MAKGVKPVQRIKKKELKEDKLVTTFFKARDYLDKQGKNLLKFGGAGILLIALVVFWFISKSKSEYRASYELGVALTAAYHADPATLAPEFSRIAEQYSGTTAANEALMYTAQMRLMANQPEEALKAFDDYLKKGRKSKYLHPSALAGKGASLEDLKRFSEAAQAYLAAATYEKNLFIAPRYYVDAARCFRLAGDISKAREQCELVKSHFPDSPFAAEAEKESYRL